MDQEPTNEPIEADGGEDELTESYTATRTSPYAIAALIFSVLAIYRGGPQPFFGQISWIDVASTSVVPVVVSIVALWLAGKGEEEIFLAEGRLGGVGFYRGARAIAVLTLVLSVGSVVIRLFEEAPQIMRIPG